MQRGRGEPCAEAMTLANLDAGSGVMLCIRKPPLHVSQHR
jgi:hypothetical protein